VGILARNGFPRPIRCVRDPRLQHPELLLLGGWERFVPDQGVGYRFRVQEEPCMEQVVLFLPEGARELTTRVGERAQVLRLEPDGQVREVRRPGPAAKG
ncbi:MAG TPA: hypothetical protein VNO81_00065, partial [Candidatus Nitrosotenuis sp.]|nr:hypothetical protein [Candidatus Nitrosotenuis sp.]